VASDLRRLTEIGWQDRVLLIEAAGALLLASLAIKLVPFRTLAARLAANSPPSTGKGQAWPREIARARWAVEACARRLPWRIVCFQKGLALHRILHRRGISTSLHYGVAQDSERGLTAHVWVTHRGEPVIGGEEAVRFTCLATFPPVGQP
jgi:hypothetical protein